MAVVLNRRYRIEQRLWAQDGVDVYLTYDAVLSRPVVARVPQASLTGDQAFLESFRRRSRLASVLAHRNIVAVLEVGEHQGTPFLIEEYVAGDQLRSIIDNEGPFVVDDVSALVDQVASGLRSSHSRGVIHGRLDPSRIIVSSSGVAKITEFGIQTGTPLDPHDNLPLNAGQWSGNENRNDPVFAIESIDVSSLGVIAYEMLTGIPPGGFASQFSRSGDRASVRVVHPSEIDPRIPWQAGEVIMRALGLAGHGGQFDVETFATALRNWQFVDPSALRSQYETKHATNSSTLPQLPDTYKSSWSLAVTPPDEAISGDDDGSNRDGQSSRVVAALTILLAVFVVAAILLAVTMDGDAGTPVTSDIPPELQLLRNLADAN